MNAPKKRGSQFGISHGCVYYKLFTTEPGQLVKDLLKAYIDC